MKEELELVENPTPKQLEKTIYNRKIRNKEKTVYFKDFIKKIAEDPNNIIDAEIIKETITCRELLKDTILEDPIVAENQYWMKG